VEVGKGKVVASSGLLQEQDANYIISRRQQAAVDENARSGLGEKKKKCRGFRDGHSNPRAMGRACSRLECTGAVPTCDIIEMDSLQQKHQITTPTHAQFSRPRTPGPLWERCCSPTLAGGGGQVRSRFFFFFFFFHALFP